MKLFFSSSFLNGLHRTFPVFELFILAILLSFAIVTDISNREGLGFAVLLKHQSQWLNNSRCTFESGALEIMSGSTFKIRVALLDSLSSVVNE